MSLVKLEFSFWRPAKVKGNYKTSALQQNLMGACMNCALWCCIHCREGMWSSLRNWILRHWVKGLFQNQFYVQQSTATGVGNGIWLTSILTFQPYCHSPTQPHFQKKWNRSATSNNLVFKGGEGEHFLLPGFTSKVWESAIRPTWSTWYYQGCMGTPVGGFLKHRNRSRENTGCAVAPAHAQHKQTERQILRYQTPSLKTECSGEPWMWRDIVGCQAQPTMVQGWLWDDCNQHNLKQSVFP